jgi:hypothetical protein
VTADKVRPFSLGSATSEHPRLTYGERACKCIRDCQFTFLSPGAYTVAFTCQEAQDSPDQVDKTVTFNPVKTGIVVTANQTTTVNIL